MPGFRLPNRLLPPFFEQDHWAGPVVLALSVFSGFLIYVILGAEANRFSSHQGPLYAVTLLGYMLAILCLWFIGTDRRPFYIHSAILLGFVMAWQAGLMEMMGGENIYNIDWYKDENVPRWEKLAAADIISVLVITVLLYLRNNTRRLLVNLDRREPAGWSVICALIAMGFHAGLSGLDHVLRIWVGWSHNLLGWYAPIKTPIEGAMEAAAPLLVLLAILQWRAQLIEKRYPI